MHRKPLSRVQHTCAHAHIHRLYRPGVKKVQTPQLHSFPMSPASRLWDGYTVLPHDCLGQVTAHSHPSPITASLGGAVLCLQRRHSSQGMNVTPALPEPGTAACCPSDKHHWPQEEVEAHGALGVTLVPGHQEGRHRGLLLNNPVAWCWGR